jgi:hypothetical protein
MFFPTSRGATAVFFSATGDGHGNGDSRILAVPSVWLQGGDFMSDHTKEPNKPDFAAQQTTALPAKGGKLAGGNCDAESQQNYDSASQFPRNYDSVSQQNCDSASQFPPGSTKFAVPWRDENVTIPTYILDDLFGFLNACEQAVYLRFYRLSHGRGSACCRVSYARLAQAAGVSARTAIRVTARLASLGLVEPLGAQVGGKGQSNEYRVHLPATFVTKTEVVREEGERERVTLSLSPSRTPARADDSQKTANNKPARRPRRPKTRSRYSLEEREAFAAWQQAQGEPIRSITSVAEKYADGSRDEKIAAWQEQQARLARLKKHDESHCEVCDDTKWQLVERNGKTGVVPCPRRAAAAAGA